MSFHGREPTGAIHIPYNWTYASQAEQDAATGFEADHEGRLARRTDNETIWMLIDYTGPTWKQVGSDVMQHAIGGSAHVADTLANVNTKISDATLDDVGDPRDPNAHDLSGAEHNSTTLADLNTKISDATLDDVGDSRPPQVHGASAHSTLDYVDLTDNLAAPSHLPGRLFYDQNDECLALYNDKTGVVAQIPRELWIRARNISGDTILNGQVVYVSGLDTDKPTIELAIANDFDIATAVIGVVTEDILDSAEGEVTNFGVVRGLNTSGYGPTDILCLSETVPGGFQNTCPEPPNYTVRVGTPVKIDAVDGWIFVNTVTFTGSDTNVNADGGLNGLVVQEQDVTFDIDVGTVYAEVANKNNPTKDLPFLIDGKRYCLNTTTGPGTGGRARVALTPGTASDPQINFIYVYLNGGNPELGVSTTFPLTDFAWIGVVSLLDVTSTNNYGVFSWEATNNAVDDGPGAGLLNNITQWIRSVGGTSYLSGVDPTVSIDTGPSPDSVNVTLGVGQVWQLQPEFFPGAGGTEYWILNHPSTGVTRITDLNEIDVVADGTLIANGDIIGLNIFGNRSSSGGVSRCFINLPDGVYSAEDPAINDSDNLAVTTVSSSQGIAATAFRVCRIVLKYTTPLGGQWENILGAGNFQEERGLPLGVGGAGGVSGSTTVFSDGAFTVFNATDPTKTGQLDMSAITTGTNRTLGYPNHDLAMPLLDGVSGDIVETNGAGQQSYRGMAPKVTAVNVASYSVLDTDEAMVVDYTSTGPCDIDFTSAQLIAQKKVWTITDRGNGATVNNITVSVDGAVVYTINSSGSSIDLYSDGSSLLVK